MSLSLGPALALGLTIPLREATGLSWRGTLLVWALCTVIAAALWLVYIRIPHVAAASGAHRGRAASASGGKRRAEAVLSDANVWFLALFLGVTSLTFYTTSAWLPAVFVLDGMPAQAAGGFTSLISIVAIPFGLIAPIAIRRGLSRFIAPAAPLLAVLGLVLLLMMGAAGALPITILLGISQGLCLGASYDQIVKFGRSPAHTASSLSRDIGRRSGAGGHRESFRLRVRARNRRLIRGLGDRPGRHRRRAVPHRAAHL